MTDMAGRAVVTMAHDEAVFLPIWYHYYARFFAPEDIHILDHETTDGSTSGGEFVRIPVSSPELDWGWHRDQLQEWQHRLLERYDMVLVVDADEIVAPDPATGTLGDYMDGFTGEFVTCQGYEVIHVQDEEPSFDPHRPLLEQRFHWFRNPVYSKSSLARAPSYWHGGMHARVDGLTNPDPNLYLLHLHRMDYDLCRARHRQRTCRRPEAVSMLLSEHGVGPSRGPASGGSNNLADREADARPTPVTKSKPSASREPDVFNTEVLTTVLARGKRQARIHVHELDKGTGVEPGIGP